MNQILDLVCVVHDGVEYAFLRGHGKPVRQTVLRSEDLHLAQCNGLLVRVDLQENPFISDVGSCDQAKFGSNKVERVHFASRTNRWRVANTNQVLKN